MKAKWIITFYQLAEEQSRLTPAWERMQLQIEAKSGDALQDLLRNIQIEKNLQNRERLIRRDILMEGVRPWISIPGNELIIGTCQKEQS